MIMIMIITPCRVTFCFGICDWCDQRSVPVTSLAIHADDLFTQCTERERSLDNKSILFKQTVVKVLVCWSLTSLCHSNGHIETMPAREINPFTALTRIRSQFLRTP